MHDTLEPRPKLRMPSSGITETIADIADCNCIGSSSNELPIEQDGESDNEKKKWTAAVNFKVRQGFRPAKIKIDKAKPALALAENICHRHQPAYPNKTIRHCSPHKVKTRTISQALQQ